MAPKLDPALLRRVVIEGVYPEVDAGRFPIKRTAGESVIVNADIHADGHDVLAARLLHRKSGDAAWAETPMEPLGNDRWTAHFTVTALGRYEYTLEGWIDRFATWQSELSKKFARRPGGRVRTARRRGLDSRLVRRSRGEGGARGSCGATG